MTMYNMHSKNKILISLPCARLKCNEQDVCRKILDSMLVERLSFLNIYIFNKLLISQKTRVILGILENRDILITIRME